MYSLRRYDWVIHIITIVICTYFVAQMASTFISSAFDSLPEEALTAPPTAALDVGPSGPVEDLESYKSIGERNIFNSTPPEVTEAGEGSEEQSDVGAGETGPAVKTNLDIKVLSTLVIGEGADHRSSAVISSGKGGKPQTYSVQESKKEAASGGFVLMPDDSKKQSEESFAPNTRLIKVARDRVEFLNGNRLEYAEIEDFLSKKSFFASASEVHRNKSGSDAKGGSSDAGGEGGEGGSSTIVLEQAQVDDALKHMDTLMTEAKMVPNFKDGQPAGMKVLSIKPGGLISKLGIRRGDVLAKINGQDLDMRQGMELFTQMKDMKNFTLDVVRRGKSQTIEYEIH